MAAANERGPYTVVARMTGGARQELLAMLVTSISQSPRSAFASPLSTTAVASPSEACPRHFQVDLRWWKVLSNPLSCTMVVRSAPPCVTSRPSLLQWLCHRRRCHLPKLLRRSLQTGSRYATKRTPPQRPRLVSHSVTRGTT